MTRHDFLKLMGAGLATALFPRAATAASAYDFWFTRLRYQSGDWDVDQRMPSNIITSLIDYTNLRVDPKVHFGVRRPRVCCVTGPSRVRAVSSPADLLADRVGRRVEDKVEFLAILRPDAIALARPASLVQQPARLLGVVDQLGIR